VQLVAPGSTQDLQAQIASLKEENRELSRANDTLKAASTFLGQSSTANSTHSRAPDLVKRRFVADPPNQLWVSDFTSGSTWEGFVYVAFIVDVYSRMVVGWRVSMTMTAKLVTDALEHAVWTRKRPVVGAIDRHPQPHPRCDAKHRSIQSPEFGVAGDWEGEEGLRKTVVSQRANSFDVAIDNVAGFEEQPLWCADAFWRAGEDQVSCLQCQDAR
jgi:Integrase core domain